MIQTAVSQSYQYSIDPAHSSVRFWVRHMMIAKVHGEISDVKGTVTLDPERPEAAQVDAEIALESLTTGNEQRDAHLKSADFFDVEQFPSIKFRATGIKVKGGEDYEIVGDLTIHGLTREVTFKAEVTREVASFFGGYKIGVSASGVIDREAFGMTWNQALETGGVLVGKEVHFQIDLELDRIEGEGR
jgi:polyisoprenoid-binding protein YceI